MSPWKQKPLETLALAGGGKLIVEMRGVPARHRDLWIVIHGFGGSREAPLARYLMRRLREAGAVVALPDLPGHGNTGGELTLSSGMETIDAIWDQWGALAGRVILLGFSVGGLLSTHWAVAHPKKVQGLVLGAPAFRPQEHFLEVLEGKEDGSLDSLQRELTTPTQILHGKADATSPWEDSLEFFRHARAPVELCIIPETSHTFAGKEALLFRRIRAFWQGLAPRNAT